MAVARSRKGSFLDSALCIVAGIALAATLVAAGFAAAAATDAPTRLLANAFSNDASSPYDKDELVTAAVATKRYTIDDNDRAALYAAMSAVARDAEADGRALPQAIDLQAAYLGPDTDGTQQSASEFTAAGGRASGTYERYILTPDAISHLDDVYGVVQAARPALAAAVVAAYTLCIAAGVRRGKRALGGILVGAGAGVLAAFFAMAVWVMLDFDGFFATFHSLFFAAGTWTFSWDSLLICMYPPEFWMGMGAIWLIVTVAACAVCLIIGRSLRRAGTHA